MEEKMTQEKMQEAFWAQANEQLENCREEGQHIPKVGLEVELFLTENGSAVPNTVLPNLPFVDQELGGFQIELLTDPVVMNSIEDLHIELSAKESLLKENSNGFDLIRIGAFPNMALEDIFVTDKEKYQIVPKFHDNHRENSAATVIGGINFNKANSVSLFSATQFNIQANSLDDAIEKMNYSLMISPFIIAASGNAGVIDNKITGWNDIRMPAWEASHDTRTAVEKKMNKETRLGLPNSYIKDINDYLQRCAAHPFILDNPQAALPIGIGLCWLDTRIKFIDDLPIVEYRAMSTQPTAKEDIAFAMFYVGRLAYAQNTKEELMPIRQVEYNRLVAMRFGLNGNLLSEKGCLGLSDMDACSAVENELYRAEKGLEMIGYQKNEVMQYTNLIRKNLEKKQTPNDRFVTALDQMPMEQALALNKI